MGSSCLESQGLCGRVDTWIELKVLLGKSQGARDVGTATTRVHRKFWLEWAPQELQEKRIVSF